jgi:hypothetical protein
MAKRNQEEISRKTKERLVWVPIKASYSFPPVCSCCLGEAEENLETSITIPYGTFTKTVSIKFPVCWICKDHIRNWRLFKIFFFFFLFLMIFQGLFFFIFPSIVGLLRISIPVIMLVIYFRLKSRWRKRNPGHADPVASPVKFHSYSDHGGEGVTFAFRNPKFAELFAGLNGGTLVE